MARRWNRMVFDEDELGDVVSITVLGSDEPVCSCGDLACLGCSADPEPASGQGLPTGGLAQRLSAMADSSVTDRKDTARESADGLADRMRSLVHDGPEPAPIPAPPELPVPTEQPRAPLEAAAEPEVEEIVAIRKPAPQAPAGWTYRPRTANDTTVVQLHARLVNARRRLRSLRPGGHGFRPDRHLVQEIPKAPPRAAPPPAPPSNVPSL